MESWKRRGKGFTLKRNPSGPDQEGLQPCADKLIDGPLYLFPVGAVIAQHDLIDGQAAIHLENKRWLRPLQR